MGNRRAKDIIKKLKKARFIEISQKGSHIKMRKGNITIIIPDHGGKDLGLGLIKSLEKISGINLL